METIIKILAEKRWQNLIFFCIILILSVAIHRESSDANYFMSFQGQIGAVTPIVLVAFFPYWIIKLFYGLYLKATKGEFSWINNKLLYLIPLLIWIAIMYIMYAPQYASQSEWQGLF